MTTQISKIQHETLIETLTELSEIAKQQEEKEHSANAAAARRDAARWLSIVSSCRDCAVLRQLRGEIVEQLVRDFNKKDPNTGYNRQRIVQMQEFLIKCFTYLA